MTEILLGAPLAGWASSLDAVADPVFADRMIGDGLAIDPVLGEVRAPCEALVVAVAATLHSVTLRIADAVDLLIHVGLDTVAGNGTGFTVHVEAGQRVAAGDLLLGFDLDLVASYARDLVTPILLTSEDASLELLATGRLVAVGDPIMSIRLSESLAAPAVAKGETVRQSLVVSLPHGLHARPAARLVALLKRRSADVRYEAHGRTADGRSMVGIMALGIRQGDTLSLEASGPDAVHAIDAIVGMIESGMGEAASPTVPVPRQATVSAGSVLTGVTAAPGLAVGVAVRVARQQIAVPSAGAGPGVEGASLSAGLASLARDLTAVDGPGAEISAAHVALLEDPALAKAAQDAIAAGRSAGAAWRLAIEAAAAALQATGDRLLTERIADLTDLSDQLLLRLYPDANRDAAPSMAPNSIIVADELLPSQFLALNLDLVKAIVTTRGGPTSHVAILAAAANIPMLVAVGPRLAEVAVGQKLVVDATAGCIDTDPGADALDAAEQRGAVASARQRSDLKAAQTECRTSDGTRIEVFANLSGVNEATRAVASGAEGCGLLRTEFLFLDRDAAPDEDEQAEIYAAIAKALAGRPLIVRTLDIGGDKPVPYLPHPLEDNPALGARGVRFSLARPDLLATQLRAILRGVPGEQCRIMVPMVVEPSELQAVSAALDAAMLDTGRANRPPLGVMIETPSAALLAEAIAEQADFLSVGTNDLTQYALACDRGNPATAAMIDPLHPAVLRLIKLAADGSARHSRWLGVCGSVASDPVAVPFLLGLGVTELSVAPVAVPGIKAAVRELQIDQCRKLATRALACNSAAQVRALALVGARAAS